MIRCVLCLLMLVASTAALAASPTLNRANPRGLQRGQTATLILNCDGIGLANPEILTRMPGRLEKLEVAAPNRLLVDWTVPADAPLGSYPIAIRTADGLTRPLLIAIDDLPQAVETEPNDPGSAQVIDLPLTVEGTSSGTDRDAFQLEAIAGEPIVIEVEARRLGSGLDPALTVLDAEGHLLASEVDARPLAEGDRRLVFDPPADGTYTLIINDLSYSGGRDPFYRLRIGSFPIAEAIYPLGWRRGESVDLQFLGGSLSAPVRSRIDTPGDLDQSWLAVSPPFAGTIGQAPFRLVLGDDPEQLELEASEEPHPLPINTVLNGRISTPGEADRYRVSVEPGRSYIFELNAARLGSPLDAVLKLMRQDGSTLAQADDSQGFDPRLSFRVPGEVSELIVQVEDLMGRGGLDFAYRLVVRPSSPGFDLSVSTPAVTIPQGASVLVPVKVARQDFNEPIQLSIPETLTGINASGGLIPGDANEGTLVLAAAPGTEPAVVPLEIWGTAGPPSKPIRRQARLGESGTPVPPLHPLELPAVVGNGPPIRLSASVEELTFLHGEETSLVIKVDRPEDHKDDINLTTAGLPGQISGGTATIKADQAETTLVYKVESLSPLTRADLILTATTKAGDRDETITLPPIRAIVRRPYELEVLTPEISLAAGSKGTIIGLIRRIPPFNTPVVIAQEGSLPSGLTVVETTIGPEETLVQIAINAAEPTAPGTFEVALRASADMPGRKSTKDYVIPDVPIRVTITPAETEPVAAN
ncbi:hypothetical protein BH23PLA1_BH23PLA1_04470 [soil metagenome]